MIGIILFCVIVVALLVVLVYLWFGKKSKGKEPPKTLSETPKEEKPAEVTDSKPESKEEIPEILKEVTQGNYLHDIAESNEDPLEFSMTENPKLKRSDITFKPIQLEGEMEDEPLTTQDILDQLDDEEPTSLSQEIKNLSPELKALLIASLLNKKDKF